jgi:hypothetical protein
MHIALNIYMILKPFFLKNLCKFFLNFIDYLILGVIQLLICTCLMIIPFYQTNNTLTIIIILILLYCYKFLTLISIKNEIINKINILKNKSNKYITNLYLILKYTIISNFNINYVINNSLYKYNYCCYFLKNFVFKVINCFNVSIY